MSFQSPRVELRPNRIEGELRGYLEKWLRQAHRSKQYRLDDLAKEAIEHIVSRAFLAGKIKASRETATPWQIVGDDSQVIQAVSEQFEGDFEKIMSDTRYDVLLETTDWPKVGTRLEVLAQMLTWKSYNLGKASEFRRSLQASAYLGAQYKYEGFFMILTEADERVCDYCAPYAGTLTEDLDDLLSPFGGEWPPWHVGCRCSVVGRPTVDVFSEQDRFRERWLEEEFAPMQEAT